MELFADSIPLFYLEIWFYVLEPNQKIKTVSWHDQVRLIFTICPARECFMSYKMIIK